MPKPLRNLLDPQKMNTTQRAILGVSILILGVLLIYPPGSDRGHWDWALGYWTGGGVEHDWIFQHSGGIAWGWLLFEVAVLAGVCVGGLYLFDREARGHTEVAGGPYTQGEPTSHSVHGDEGVRPHSGESVPVANTASRSLWDNRFLAPVGFIFLVFGVLSESVETIAFGGTLVAVGFLAWLVRAGTKGEEDGGDSTSTV